MRLYGSCLPQAQLDGPCPLESLQLRTVSERHTHYLCVEIKDTAIISNNAVACAIFIANILCFRMRRLLPQEVSDSCLTKHHDPIVQKD